MVATLVEFAAFVTFEFAVVVTFVEFAVAVTLVEFAVTVVVTFFELAVVVKSVELASVGTFVEATPAVLLVVVFHMFPFQCSCVILSVCRSPYIKIKHTCCLSLHLLLVYIYIYIYI